MCRTQSKQKNMATRRVNAMEGNSENSDIIYIGELKRSTSSLWICIINTDTITLCSSEKELMAVIYGFGHFNYYTYGRIVTVQTDLANTGLSKKPYDTTSPHLHRMLL
ncbi:hypothetical protein TNCV_486131 [Trichonephila clavipes]|nr:hypothetical protein TNCV_486131 [Trichonephila clavipes]